MLHEVGNTPRPNTRNHHMPLERTVKRNKADQPIVLCPITRYKNTDHKYAISWASTDVFSCNNQTAIKKAFKAVLALNTNNIDVMRQAAKTDR